MQPRTFLWHCDAFVINSVFSYLRRQQSRGYSFVLRLSFLHDISKTDAVRMIELDNEMFHDKSWKLYQCYVTKT